MGANRDAAPAEARGRGHSDARAGARRGGGAQTVTRGLRVLRVLAQHPDGLSVSELAAALSTHRAGIYRLLGALAGERLVQRGADGRYRLGLGLLELAGAVRSRLQDVAVPELRRLADELRATTALTVRDGDEAVVLAVVEPQGTDMRVAYRPGLRHAITVAAPGLAILSAGPPRSGERAEVSLARRRGFAQSTGELLPGATGVAAPILASGEPEASISAVWLEPRDVSEMAEPVVRAAQAIAASL